MENEESNKQLLDDFINLRGDGRTLYNQVFRFVRNRLKGNYDDAEDVMIDVQLRAWKNRDKYESIRKIEPWLYTIASSSVKDHFRKQKRFSSDVPLENSLNGEIVEREVIDKSESEVYRLELNDDLKLVKEHVYRLPEILRDSILLAYYEGKSLEEVSQILDLPYNTVKNRIFRGKNLLKENLQKKFAA